MLVAKWVKLTADKKVAALDVKLVAYLVEKLAVLKDNLSVTKKVANLVDY